MLESIGKNLWILITIVLPGLFTYGAWRLLLLLHPSTALTNDAFKLIDDSGTITCCIITAIALSQQAIAIVIEFLLSIIALMQKEKQGNFRLLLWNRFKLACTGCLNDSATRIIGNFFLSLNILVGLLMLLAYFVWFEHLPLSHWIPKSLMIVIAANFVTIIYRLINAISVVAACKELPKQHIENHLME